MPKLKDVLPLVIMETEARRDLSPGETAAMEKMTQISQVWLRAVGEVVIPGNACPYCILRGAFEAVTAQVAGSTDYSHLSRLVRSALSTISDRAKAEDTMLESLPPSSDKVH